jgi:O-antigen/teichoic acid export membrane protein
LLVANASQWFYLWAIVTFRHGRARLKLDLNSGLILLKEAFPLGIAEILRRSARHVGVLLLTALSTPAAVGLFSASYKFLDGMAPFTLNLTLPLFPVFSRLAQVSHARLFRAYEQSLKFLYAASFPLAVVTFVLSERIVIIVFGEPYRDAAFALRIFAPAIVFLMSSSVYGYVFTALGRQRAYMACVAISLVVNIVLDLVLIPSFSYNGAAIGTLVSEVVLFLTGLFVLQQLGSDLTSLLAVWRPILASLVMGGICWLVRDKTVATMLLGVCCSAAVYAGLLFVLRTFTQEEHALLADAFCIRSGSSLR